MPKLTTRKAGTATLHLIGALHQNGQHITPANPPHR